MSKDYSISFARFVAMCFIVLCHIMQRDGFATEIRGGHIEWAYWFNVGVQMFLFLSGYLYGRKNKIDIVKFVRKAFPRVLCDYYIFVIFAIALFSLHHSFNKDEIIGLLTFSATIPGLGHLWFIPTILFCYLLVPVLASIVNEINQRKNLRFWITSIVILVTIHIVLKRFFSYFNPAWINCFVLGMLYCKIEKRNMRRLFIGLVTILCLLIIPLQFRIDYWPHGVLPTFLQRNYGIIINYGHVFLGIIIVILLQTFYRRISFKSCFQSVLEWSDNYSYDVYLVHHIFVLSSFGCVEYIQNRWIAIPAAIVLTVFSAMALNKLAGYAKHKMAAMIMWRV